MGDQQQLSAAEEEKNVAVAVPETEPHSDSAGEVGGNEKHPCMGSIDQEDGLLVSDYKKMKIEESSMTGAVGLPCGISHSADESLGDSNTKNLHDKVDNYIKSCFGKGNYRELHDEIENGKGIWGDHLRAVIRAKVLKRKRGESENAKDLCGIPSLDDEGLTYTEIFKLQRYFHDYMEHICDKEAWLREVKKKGVYGAYLRALIRAPKAPISRILVEMKKEKGVSLKYLAVAVTETSLMEVRKQSSSSKSSDGAHKEA